MEVCLWLQICSFPLWGIHCTTNNMYIRIRGDNHKCKRISSRTCTGPLGLEVLISWSSIRTLILIEDILILMTFTKAAIFLHHPSMAGKKTIPLRDQFLQDHKTGSSHESKAAQSDIKITCNSARGSFLFISVSLNYNIPCEVCKTSSGQMHNFSVTKLIWALGKLHGWFLVSFSCWQPPRCSLDSPFRCGSAVQTLCSCAVCSPSADGSQPHQ